ncbi:MAG: O-antigen ligase family protein [Phycisphaerales bacterium]|nr:MAG: O-antigen ligase family protein [Phycisphaerales bacterium]
MPIKTIAFLIGLVICTTASLFNPLYGIVGYVFHYTVWPEMQWWGSIFNPWGVRYSLIFATVTLIGIIVNMHRLRWGRHFISRQEALIGLFLVVALLTDQMARSDTVLNPDPDPNGLMLKLVKITAFVFMLSHVITDVGKFRALLWVFVLTALYLGVQAYNAPISRFTQARLNHMGGPDFWESSFFGAHLVAMLPFLGIFFLCGTIRMKVFALLTTGFVINAIILTRTRAAFIGVLAGLLAALFVRFKRRKLRLILCLVPAIAVSLWLTDAGFRRRMQTILNPPEQRDTSATNRLEIWDAAYRMVQDRPFGVGAGNFAYAIKFWHPSGVMRDAHNTFIRCAGELGVHSAALLLIIVLNGWVTILQAWRRCRGTRDEREIQHYCYAIAVCQCAYFATGMFMTTLYVEEFWWFLVMPVCILRCAENAQAETAELPLDLAEARRPAALKYELPPLAWGRDL